jgi:hypothetical protein
MTRISPVARLAVAGRKGEGGKVGVSSTFPRTRRSRYSTHTVEARRRCLALPSAPAARQITSPPPQSKQNEKSDGQGKQWAFFYIARLTRRTAAGARRAAARARPAPCPRPAPPSRSHPRVAGRARPPRARPLAASAAVPSRHSPPHPFLFFERVGKRASESSAERESGVTRDGMRAPLSILSWGQYGRAIHTHPLASAHRASPPHPRARPAPPDGGRPTPGGARLVLLRVEAWLPAKKGDGKGGAS